MRGSDGTRTQESPFALARRHLEENGMRIVRMRQDYADMVFVDTWHGDEVVLVHVYERNPRRRMAHLVRHVEPPLSEDDVTRLRSDCALFLAEHPKASAVRVDLVGISYPERGAGEPSVIYDRDVVRL